MIQEMNEGGKNTMKRWMALLVVLSAIFALGLSFVLPTGLASLPSAKSVLHLNIALALLALIGIAVVLTIARRRFCRKNNEI